VVSGFGGGGVVVRAGVVAGVGAGASADVAVVWSESRFGEVTGVLPCEKPFAVRKSRAHKIAVNQ